MIKFRTQKTIIGILDTLLIVAACILGISVAITCLEFLLEDQFELMVATAAAGIVTAIFLAGFYALLRIWELVLLNTAERHGIDTSHWLSGR